MQFMGRLATRAHSRIVTMTVAGVPPAACSHISYFRYFSYKIKYLFWRKLIASPAAAVQTARGKWTNHREPMNRQAKTAGAHTCECIEDDPNGTHQQTLIELSLSFHSCVNVWFIDWKWPLAKGQWTECLPIKTNLSQKDHLCRAERSMCNDAEIERNKLEN